MYYKHTQPGYVTLGLLYIVGIILVAGSMFHNGVNLKSAFVIFVLLVSGVLFATLTAEVKEGSLSWYFGPGFWKKDISLNEIEKVNIITTPWYYGRGIRYTPQGWPYNVSGFSALQFYLINGKKDYLGY